MVVQCKKTIAIAWAVDTSLKAAGSETSEEDGTTKFARI